MDSSEADCSDDHPESVAAEQGQVDSSSPADTAKDESSRPICDSLDDGDVEQPVVEMKEVDEAMGDAAIAGNEEVVVDGSSGDHPAAAPSPNKNASHPSPQLSPQPDIPAPSQPRHQPLPYDLNALVASAISLGDFNGLLSRLEEIELDATDGIPPTPVFSCMIATNLILDDVVNAKMVWKRTPYQLKAENPELCQLWRIGVKCWARDYSGLFYELNKNYDWGPQLQPLVTALSAALRDRVLSLVEKSYESVRLTWLSSLLGMTSHDSVMALAADRDWHIEQGYTFPLKTSATTTSRNRDNNADDALARLTEYVSFLEE